MVFGVALMAAPTQAQPWTPKQVPQTLTRTTLQAGTSSPVRADGPSTDTGPAESPHLPSLRVLAQLQLQSNVPAPGRVTSLHPAPPVQLTDSAVLLSPDLGPAQPFHLGPVGR